MLHMKTLLAGSLVGLVACTPLVLAPGAAQVRVTDQPAEVASCTAVGNMRVPEDANGMVDVIRAVRNLQNQTIGLGGNVAFVTDGSPKFPQAGIAYKCP